MIPITRAIKKNAHHIPALKIVSIAPQLLKVSESIKSNTTDNNFMMLVFRLHNKIQVSYQMKTGCEGSLKQAQCNKI